MIGSRARITDPNGDIPADHRPGAIPSGPGNSSATAGAGAETVGEERRGERKSGQTRVERSAGREGRATGSGRSGFVRCTDSRWPRRRERAAMGCMDIVSRVCEGGISLVRPVHYQRIFGERNPETVNLR